MSSEIPSLPKDQTLSACDECRARKLKCSGELTGCSRCLVEGVLCHYSQKKTMGRPRKRRREEQQSYPIENANLESYNGMNFTGSDVVIPNSFSDHIASSGSLLDPSLTANGWQASTVPEVNGHSGEWFNYQFAQEPSMDSPQHFPSWRSTQSPTKPPPIPCQQLQTPPTALSYQGPTVLPPPLTCTCLPSLYSTLSSLQSPPPPSFPYSLGLLKRSARLANTVVHCPTCPQSYNTAVQNSTLLCTLLQLLIAEYIALLKHIDERASGDENIPFRLGEPGVGPFDPRHTGGPDCPMAINIELDGGEWRVLARKAVRKEVSGEGEGGAGGLVGVVGEMRRRQGEMHGRFTRREGGQGLVDDSEHVKGACLQVALVDNIGRALEGLGV